MNAPNPLALLRQVAGVNAAFVVDDSGLPILRDSDATPAPATLHALGQRFQSLITAASEGVPGAEEVFLRGTHGALYLRKVPPGFLAVLCAETCIVTRLRSVAATVAKSLESSPIPEPARSAVTKAARPAAKRPWWKFWG